MKLFSLPLIVFVFLTFGVTSIFGQDLSKECESIYGEYVANRKGPEIEKFEKAIRFGKLYLEKCSNLKGEEVVRDYVTKDLPKIEVKLEIDPVDPAFKRCNSAIPIKNYDDAFLCGKAILARNPDFIDIMLVFASIGYENATANPPSDKYNQDAITFAKTAIQKMSEGKTSDNYGAFHYTYKTNQCPDGKSNATGWMNYIIGYILSVRQKQKELAIPYLYQSTQVGCETKEMFESYKLIGDWYLEKAKSDNKIYVERALDTYARAYNFAKRDTKPMLFKKTETLFKLIHKTDIKNFEVYLTNVKKTHFADPNELIIKN